MKKTSVVFLCILIVNTLSASISFSGSARVRPRYDLKIYQESNGDITQSGDLYFQYEAKLNIKADMGGGYFFNGQIAHNSLANWSQMGDGKDLPSTSSDGSAQAPSIAFNEISIGYRGEKTGYRLGRISYAHNTLLDIHYYPTKLLDIPFFIYNNNAFTGAELTYNAGKHQLKAAFSVDEDRQEYEHCILDGLDSIAHDPSGYTAIAETALRFDRITLNPGILYSFGKEISNPFTAGLRAQYVYKGLTLKTEFAFSRSDQAADLYRYNGIILRAEAKQKLGIGTLRFMYDHASMKYTKYNGVDYGTPQAGIFHYTWLEYTIPVYKSDQGSVTLRPVWRHCFQNLDISGQIYKRHKIELFIQYDF